MMKYVCSLFRDGEPEGEALTNVDASVDSHIMALAAEASRLAGGASIELDRFSEC